MNKINICFPFNGDSIGGSHISALELINGLDKNNFNPVIVIHKKGLFYEHLKKNKIKIIFFPINRLIGQKKGIAINCIYLIYNFFKIKRFIKEKKIHFVHTNDATTHLTWIIPTKFSRSKFFWHLRVKFPNWRLYKILISLSDKIICISKYVKKTLPTKLRKKSIVIYNQISLSNRKIEISKKNKFFYSTNFKNKKKILFVANIIKSKKVDVFIKSALKVFKKNKSFVFLVIGSDKFNILNKIILNLRNKEFEKSFFYLGQSFNIKYWLKKSDLLLATAINEGHNRIIVESMLAKLPVIASKSAGHKETIINKETGWFVKPNDYNELANMTLKFFKLKQSQKNKITRNAFESVNKKFNVMKSKKIMEKLYRNNI